MRLPIAIGLLSATTIALLGTTAYAAISDECSYAPDGDLDLRLVPEGIAHFLDDEHACDPWRVVKPDTSVQTITILPYSSWTAAPPRAVTIERNGRLTISEPLEKASDADWPQWDYQERVSVDDPVLAHTLLQSLSRVARFNRMPAEPDTAIMDKYWKGLTDLEEGEPFLLEPRIPCRGTLYDGGGVELKIENSTGTEIIWLESGCHSIAKEQAINLTWEARMRVFEAAGFTDEHFVEERAKR